MTVPMSWKLADRQELPFEVKGDLTATEREMWLANRMLEALVDESREPSVTIPAIAWFGTGVLLGIAIMQLLS